jgi:phosphoglycerate dehydrogenase-like enzyme
MPPRPALAVAMVPMLNRDLLVEEHWRRLGMLCDILDREPITAFADPHAVPLLARTEILLTGWGCPRIDDWVLDHAPHLQAVVHAAGTVKDHVSEAVWVRGIRVTSAAAANAVPVAEYTLAAILFANKRVFQAQRRYREARQFRWWPEEFPGLGNYRKTVGIVGASYVGRKVIELLRPFDFTLLLNDPFVDAAAATTLGARKVDLDDLLDASDIVSLHAPALPETRHLIDALRLRRMRDGATLINTARGWLVDHAALETELRGGRINAVIDTTEPEVLDPDSPLYDLPNVLLTPHIAGSMGTETQRMATLAIDEIERLVGGQPLRYEIRAADLGRLA